jgi:hypothetical protein
MVHLKSDILKRRIVFLSMMDRPYVSPTGVLKLIFESLPDTDFLWDNGSQCLRLDEWDHFYHREPHGSFL